MTRDGGTPCGCNGKSLVVVDVIYIYICLFSIVVFGLCLCVFRH